MPIKKRADGDNLKAFRNHGFKQNLRLGTETQVVGNCVFCGKDDHFYINRESKQWDCKRCGRAGGFQMFLKQLAECNKLSEGDGRLKELSAQRGISEDTLLAFDLGFNPYTNEYSFPIWYNEAGELSIYNLRRYDMETGGLRSTAGCNNGILNWDVAAGYDTLWLCEGEWDAMAMAEILFAKERDSEELALGMPGAGLFKPDWISLFNGKKVNVVYDADDPGRAGAKKCYKLLKRVASRLRFVHWGEVRDGYDVRDCYIDYGDSAYEHIKERLEEIPEGTDISDIKMRNVESYTGSGLPIQTVYDTYRKWLYMPNTDVVDVVFGTAIANRQKTDNVWMFLVAEPGATKTSMLECLIEAPNIVYKNQLGAKSLVSGQMMAGGDDPSLLPKLHEKILVIEDFTTVLSVPLTFRDEIFGILRAAYNGRYERDYGNGRIFRCDCEFGILAGVTPAIEHYSDSFAALGERFLSYYLPVPKDLRGRRPYLRKAMDNRGREKEMKAELRRVAREALMYPFDKAPGIPANIDDRLLDLAQWTSMVRGTVRREKYSAQKEVTNEPYSELGTRLIKQFSSLVDGIGRFRRVDVVGEHEYKIVKRIAFGSTPPERRKFLKAMWTDPTKGWDTNDIAEMSGLPRFPMCERIAETLYLLGAIRKSKTINGLRSTYLWHIEDDFAEMTESTGILS